MKKLCLHIGCGRKRVESTPEKEWVNIDIVDYETVDKVMDVRELKYKDESIDEIYMPHIIEDFDRFEGERVLKEVYRVLKPGAKLTLELVDLRKCAELYLGDDPRLSKIGRDGFYGSQEDEANRAGWHKWGFDKEDIRKVLEKYKFAIGKIYYGGSHYKERDLVVEARKQIILI